MNLRTLERLPYTIVSTAKKRTITMNRVSMWVMGDGASDRFLEIMLEQHRADPRFSIIALSHNFAIKPAVSTGLE